MTLSHLAHHYIVSIRRSRPNHSPLFHSPPYLRKLRKPQGGGHYISMYGRGQSGINYFGTSLIARGELK